MEALLLKYHQEQKPEAKLKYVSTHKAVSCTMGTNVRGFEETVCVVEPNTEVLVAKMFDYFFQVREKSAEISTRRWGNYLNEVRHKIDIRREQLQNTFRKSQS